MKTHLSTPSRAARLASAAAVCGAIGLLAGCAYEPESHLLTAPPPAPPAAAPAATVYTVPTTPAPTVATVPTPTGASSIVVMQAPPAVQQEVPTARPTRDHVWVPGYWTWRNSRYEWVAGHWVIPPTSGAVWVPPRWQPEGNSWRFYEGYWD